MAQSVARENHYFLCNGTGKGSEESFWARSKGSGEHWLRPVFRALASEPRRSVAIRALPLPNSILLAKKVGGFSGYFRGRPALRRILSSFSPPARRRRGDAHRSESLQSLLCTPSEQRGK